MVGLVGNLRWEIDPGVVFRASVHLGKPLLFSVCEGLFGLAAVALIE